MSVHYAIVERTLPGCGRDQDRSWLNVLIGVQVSPGTWDDLLAHPNYSNPSFPRFVVQLTAGQFASFQQSGLVTPGCSNLPLWQQRVAGTGEATELGHFSDPRNAGSIWVPDAPIPDDRLIVRIYDGDPTAGGQAIGSRPGNPPTVPPDPPGGENLDESQDPGFVTRWLRLFSPTDVPLTTNAQNQKVVFGGKEMIFDLTNGMSTFEVSTRRAGRVPVGSNHKYKVVGPNGESTITFAIYGRRLEVLI